MTLDIERVLTISTQHISLKTSLELAKAANPNIQINYPAVYEKGEYGWWVYVSDDRMPDLPEDLKRLLDLAWQNECQWLCLDCDGQELDDLPTYDW